MILCLAQRRTCRWCRSRSSSSETSSSCSAAASRSTSKHPTPPSGALSHSHSHSPQLEDIAASVTSLCYARKLETLLSLDPLCRAHKALNLLVVVVCAGCTTSWTCSRSGRARSSRPTGAPTPRQPCFWFCSVCSDCMDVYTVPAGYRSNWKKCRSVLATTRCCACSCTCLLLRCDRVRD